MSTLDDKQQRGLLWLAVAAVCWRWLLGAQTPVPAEDGANYLWMAQRFAAGDAAAALSEPFSPLWPLLLALPLRLGADPFTAAKVLGCLCGGLALWPIALVGERLRAGAGLPAAALAATSRLFALGAVEGYTEPLFALVVACGLLAGMRERWWWLGLCSALAFLVRPEGVLLPLPFALARGGFRALLPCVGAVLAFAGWRAACGLGFDPVPKVAFHGLRDDLGSERGNVLQNLLALPTAYMEAFLCAGALAALALLPPRAPALRRLGALLGLTLLPMLTFVVRRRFFVGWTPVVLPLSGAGVAALTWLGPRGRELLLGLACGLDLWTAWQGTIDEHRVAERLVGQHLAARLGPGQTVAGDLPRVLWYAGQRPLPPRHFDAAWFVAQARAPEVQFVALVEPRDAGRRADFAAIVQGLGDAFARYDLPPELRDAAERRDREGRSGIAVFVRR